MTATHGICTCALPVTKHTGNSLSGFEEHILPLSVSHLFPLKFSCLLKGRLQDFQPPGLHSTRSSLLAWVMETHQGSWHWFIFTSLAHACHKATQGSTTCDHSHYLRKVWDWDPPLQLKYWAHTHTHVPFFFVSLTGVSLFIKLV